MKIEVDLVNLLYPFLVGVGVGAGLANIILALSRKKEEVKDENNS